MAFSKRKSRGGDEENEEPTSREKTTSKEKTPPRKLASNSGAPPTPIPTSTPTATTPSNLDDTDVSISVDYTPSDTPLKPLSLSVLNTSSLSLNQSVTSRTIDVTMDDIDVKKTTVSLSDATRTPPRSPATTFRQNSLDVALAESENFETSVMELSMALNAAEDETKEYLKYNSNLKSELEKVKGELEKAQSSKNRSEVEKVDELVVADKLLKSAKTELEKQMKENLDAKDTISDLTQKLKKKEEEFSEEIKAAATSAAMNALEESEVELGIVKGSLQKATADIVELRATTSAEVEDLKRALRDKSAECNKLKSGRESLVGELNELKAVKVALGDVEAERDALKHDLSESNKTRSAAMELESDKVATLERECGALKLELGEINDSCLALQSERDALKHDLSESNKTRSAAMELESDKVATLERECGALKLELGEINYSCLALQSERDALKHDLSESNKTRSALDAELSESRENLSVQRTNCESLQSEIDSLRNSSGNKLDEVNMLKTVNEQISAECAALRELQKSNQTTTMEMENKHKSTLASLSKIHKDQLADLTSQLSLEKKYREQAQAETLALTSNSQRQSDSIIFTTSSALSNARQAKETKECYTHQMNKLQQTHTEHIEKMQNAHVSQLETLTASLSSSTKLCDELTRQTKSQEEELTAVKQVAGELRSEIRHAKVSSQRAIEKLTEKLDSSERLKMNAAIEYRNKSEEIAIKLADSNRARSALEKEVERLKTKLEASITERTTPTKKNRNSTFDESFGMNLMLQKEIAETRLKMNEERQHHENELNAKIRELECARRLQHETEKLNCSERNAQIHSFKRQMELLVVGFEQQKDVVSKNFLQKIDVSNDKLKNLALSFDKLKNSHKSMNTQNTAYQQTIGELREMNNSFRDQVSELSKTVREQDNSLAAERAAAEESRNLAVLSLSKKAELNDKILSEVLTVEIQKVNERIDNNLNAFESNVKNEQLLKLEKRCLAAEGRLNASVKLASAHGAACAVARTELAAAVADSNSAKERIKALETEIESMRDSFTRISEVNAETLKQQLNQFEKIEVSRSNQIESAKKRTLREQKVQSVLKQELDAKTSMVLNLENRLKETEWEMNLRETQNIHALNENRIIFNEGKKTSREKLDEKDAVIATMESDLVDLRRIVESNSCKATELEELLVEKMKADAATEELRAFGEASLKQLGEKEAMIVSMESELNELRRVANDDTLKRMSSSDESLVRLNEKLQNQVRKLEADNGVIIGELKNEKSKQLRTIEELTSDNNDQATIIQDLEQRIRRRETEHGVVIDKLQWENAEQEGALEQLKEQLVQLRSKEEEEKEDMVAMLQKKNSELRQIAKERGLLIERFETEKKNVQEEVEKAKMTNVELSATVADLNFKIQFAESAKAEQANTIAQLNADLQQAWEGSRCIQKEVIERLTEMETHSDNQAEKIAKLKEQVSHNATASEEEKVAEETMIVKLTAVNEEMKKKITDKEDALVMMQNQVNNTQDKLTAEIRELRDKFEEQRKRQDGIIDRLTVENADLKERISTKELEMKKLLAFTIDKSSTQSKAANEQLQELEEKNAKLDSELKNLNSERLLVDKNYLREVETMSRELREQKVIIANLVAEVRRYDEDNKGLKEELVESSKVGQANLSTLDEKFHTLNEKCQTLQRVVESKNVECNNLTNLLEARNSELMKSMRDAAVVDQLTGSLQKLSEKFENKCFECIEAEGENRRLREKVAELVNVNERNEKNLKMEANRKLLLAKLPATPQQSAEKLLTPGRFVKTTKQTVEVGVGSAFHSVATPKPEPVIKEVEIVKEIEVENNETIEKLGSELENEKKKREEVTVEKEKWKQAAITLQGALDCCVVTRDAAVEKAREESLQKENIVAGLKEEKSKVEREMKERLKESSSHHAEMQRELVEMAKKGSDVQKDEIERMREEIKVVKGRVTKLVKQKELIEKNLRAKSDEIKKAVKELENVRNEKDVLLKSLESNKIAYKCEGETWVAERERLEGEIKVCKTRLETVMAKKQENDKILEVEMKKDKLLMKNMRERMQLLERERGEAEGEMEKLKKKVKRQELKMEIEKEQRGGDWKGKRGRWGEGKGEETTWTTLKPTDGWKSREGSVVEVHGERIYSSKIRVLESDLNALEGRLKF